MSTVYGITTNHFPRWYGLGVCLLLETIVLLSIYGLVPEEEIPFLDYFVGMLIVNILTVIGWAINRWLYPRRSKKRLGVAIAIHVEDLNDYKFYKKDFLIPFRSKLHELGLPFDVLVLKSHHAEKVETSGDARLVLKKTKAHFCIWGSIKKERSNRIKKATFFRLMQ